MAEEMKEIIEPQADVVETKAEPEKKQSLEEQIQQLMLDNAKLKRAFDKSASEAAGFKKQLREKQSADEIALQEKAEKEAQREEQFNALVRENSINKFEKNFLGLGYSPEQANKAATAQVDNDTESLFKIQYEVQQSLIKAQKAEWLKSVEQINAGIGGEEDKVDPFLKGFGL